MRIHNGGKESDYVHVNTGNQETVEMQEFNVLFPTGYEIELSGHRFVLKPFTLKQLRAVTETCDRLIKKFAALYIEARNADEDGDMKFVEGIPELVIEFVEDVTFLISESLRAPREYVENNLTGKVASEMLIGIMEINDVTEMVKNFQTALDRILPAATQPTTETEPEPETEQPTEGEAETAV